jgi:hypothetical protein
VLYWVSEDDCHSGAMEASLPFSQYIGTLTIGWEPMLQELSLFYKSPVRDRRNFIVRFKIIYMRKTQPLIAIALPVAALLVLVAGFCFIPAGGKTPFKSYARGFAVVELFTSEGCSSCPPADDEVAKIANEKKDDIYVLCFHVDYWDQLGWKDAFSNAEYTQRQKQYAQTLALSSIYTPQAILNGKESMVASDDAKLRDGIKDQLEYTSNAYDNKLTLDAVSKDSKTITVSCQVKNATEDQLCFALVQLRADSKVLKGENQGRHLRHVDIVRDFKSVAPGASKAGSVELTIPDGLTTKDCKVIAFLQSQLNMQISAAGETVIK